MKIIGTKLTGHIQNGRSRYAGRKTIFPNAKKLKNGVYSGIQNTSKIAIPTRKNIDTAKLPNAGKNR
jgi:hypothetical protein